MLMLVASSAFYDGRVVFLEQKPAVDDLGTVKMLSSGPSSVCAAPWGVKKGLYFGLLETRK